MSIDVASLLEQATAVAQGHFVYKDGQHGAGYINKEALGRLGALQQHELFVAVGENAIAQGFAVHGHTKVAVLGPAYGAIPTALSVACGLERAMPDVHWFPTRSEIARDGSERHVLPDKLIEDIRGGALVLTEDIVNAGSTIREVLALVRTRIPEVPVLGALALVDRGGQTAESLGVLQYFPLLRVNMEKYDPREKMCPLCVAGVPISTVLGKGARWVDMFGQPPYQIDKDFSGYWR